MMNAPAPKLWPSALNASSAAAILTVGFLKRKLTSVLSLLFSTTMVLPLPDTPPVATTFFAIGTAVIGALRILLSVTSSTVMLRINGNVQPVSSYGDGFAGEKFWSAKY